MNKSYWAGVALSILFAPLVEGRTNYGDLNRTNYSDLNRTINNKFYEILRSPSYKGVETVTVGEVVANINLALGDKDKLKLDSANAYIGEETYTTQNGGSMVDSFQIIPSLWALSTRLALRIIMNDGMDIPVNEVTLDLEGERADVKNTPSLFDRIGLTLEGKSAGERNTLILAGYLSSELASQDDKRFIINSVDDAKKWIECTFGDIDDLDARAHDLFVYARSGAFNLREIFLAKAGRVFDGYKDIYREEKEKALQRIEEENRKVYIPASITNPDEKIVINEKSEKTIQGIVDRKGLSDDCLKLDTRKFFGYIDEANWGVNELVTKGEMTWRDFCRLVSSCSEKENIWSKYFERVINNKWSLSLKADRKDKANNLIGVAGYDDATDVVMQAVIDSKLKLGDIKSLSELENVIFSFIRNDTINFEVNRDSVFEKGGFYEILWRNVDGRVWGEFIKEELKTYYLNMDDYDVAQIGDAFKELETRYRNYLSHIPDDKLKVYLDNLSIERMLELAMTQYALTFTKNKAYYKNIVEKIATRQIDWTEATRLGLDKFFTEIYNLSNELLEKGEKFNFDKENAFDAIVEKIMNSKQYIKSDFSRTDLYYWELFNKIGDKKKKLTEEEKAIAGRYLNKIQKNVSCGYLSYEKCDKYLKELYENELGGVFKKDPLNLKRAMNKISTKSYNETTEKERFIWIQSLIERNNFIISKKTGLELKTQIYACFDEFVYEKGLESSSLRDILYEMISAGSFELTKCYPIHCLANTVMKETYSYIFRKELERINMHFTNQKWEEIWNCALNAERYYCCDLNYVFKHITGLIPEE